MPRASTPSGLAGRSIVVVGGTSGIGLSGARALVAAGARVVALGLPPSTAAAAAALGSEAIVVAGDATDRASVEAAIEAAVDAFGRLDGLYHVAGGSGRRFGDGPLHDVTDEGWHATLDLNLTSVFLSNRAATSALARAGRRREHRQHDLGARLGACRASTSRRTRMPRRRPRSSG